MSSFKRILPYLIIVVVSLAIIIAAFFVVPGFFERPETSDAPPAVDTGDSEFINMLGGTSETYVGAVSEYTYPSVESAAEAYVENEIAGNSIATDITTTSVATYTVDNVDISIPSELLEGADSIEKLNVSYKLSDDVSTMSTKSSGSEEYTVVVYVIKFGIDFKYFTPLPITGETITKSYYDSVFHSDKWSNCTMEIDSSISMNINASSYQGQTMTMTMDITMHQLIKYDDGKIYLFQESTTSMSYTGMGTEEEHSTIYAYIAEDEDGYPICYVKENENDPWIRGSLWQIGFNDIEELTPFYGDYLDYTFFSKTPYGFALEKENAKQYFMQAFDQLSGEIEGVDFGSDGVDMTVRYYVQDGALTGIQNDSHITADVSEQGATGHIEVNVEQTSTCTNYGTTVVEPPVIDQ